MLCADRPVRQDAPAGPEPSLAALLRRSGCRTFGAGACAFARARAGCVVTRPGPAAAPCHLQRVLGWALVSLGLARKRAAAPALAGRPPSFLPCPALSGLFQPPRSRDQTQTLLLEPEHENSMKKSRRGLDLQLDGYDYGKPHVLVRIRFREKLLDVQAYSAYFLSTACSWLLRRLWSAAAQVLSPAGSCRARHMVQWCYVSTRFVRLVFCRWATDLCARVAARLL